MKKIQIMLITGIIFSVLTTNATAQLAVSSINVNRDETFTYAKGNAAESKSMAKLNKANARALSNFKNSFKDESNAAWSVYPNMIVANFTKDEIKSTVIYDKSGRWIHTIQVYQENKMPEDIRSLVKRSIYYDYNISQVHQIKEGDITFYIINLIKDKKFKQVSVYDGEINVLQDFNMQ